MEEIRLLYQLNIGDISTIKRLSGGLTNEIYLINNTHLWKVFKSNNIFDHVNEKLVIENSDEMTLYYFDKNNMCYNFIEGSTISRQYFIENFDEIIRLAKTYHKRKVLTKNFWSDVLPNWIKNLPDNLYFTTKEKITDSYNFINNIISKYDDNLVLCHHDIHSANIIINNQNQLNLIDLEFSYSSYDFIELGNLICEFYTDYDNGLYQYEKITIQDIKNILNCYYGYIKLEDINKIKIGIMISHLYWCIWGINMHKNSKNSNFNYLKFSKTRFNFLTYQNYD